MGYVGNEPDANYTSFAQQTITGNGGTSYTLSHAVASGKEILLYINNVKQEEGSGKAYEATGTALTLSEAITSSDSCYCVFLGKALQTTVPPDGSVTSAKLDTNIAVSGNLDVGTIRATNGTTAQTIDSSGHVTDSVRPYFSYRLDTAQSVPTATQTNIVHNLLISQRGNDYSTTTGYFTAPVTGLYQFNADLQIATDTAWQWFLQHTNSGGTGIRTYVAHNQSSGGKTTHVSGSYTVYMTATDFVHIRVAHFYGSNRDFYGHFNGYFIG